MGGDALEVAELIDAGAEGGADFGIEFAGPAGIVGDQVIKLGPVAENAEDDFVGERCVARVERGGAGMQEVGGEATGFDKLEDVESGEAGGGNGHAWWSAG